MLGWSLNLIVFKPLEVPPLRIGVRFFGSLWMATELKLAANLVFYLTEHNWLHSSTCENKEFVNLFTQTCHYFTTAELFFKVFYKNKNRVCSVLFQSMSAHVPEWLEGLYTGTNCDLGVSLSRRNISQFSFFSLHTERIKMRWLLSESVLCLQRGDWETLFKQKSCMAQNGWYSTVNKLQLEVRNGFLSKMGVIWMMRSRRVSLFMALHDVELK